MARGDGRLPWQDSGLAAVTARVTHPVPHLQGLNWNCSLDCLGSLFSFFRNIVLAEIKANNVMFIPESLCVLLLLIRFNDACQTLRLFIYLQRFIFHNNSRTLRTACLGCKKKAPAVSAGNTGNGASR